MLAWIFMVPIGAGLAAYALRYKFDSIGTEWALNNDVPVSGAVRLTLTSYFFFDFRKKQLVIWRWRKPPIFQPYSQITRWEAPSHPAKSVTRPLYLYTSNTAQPLIEIQVGSGNLRHAVAALEAHGGDES